MSQVDCHCHIEFDEQQPKQPKLVWLRVCLSFSALVSYVWQPLPAPAGYCLPRCPTACCLSFLPLSFLSHINFPSSPFFLLYSFCTRSLLKLLSFSFLLCVVALVCYTPVLSPPPSSLHSPFCLPPSFYTCSLSLCLSCFALLCVALASVSSFCLPHAHRHIP